MKLTTKELHELIELRVESYEYRIQHLTKQLQMERDIAENKKQTLIDEVTYNLDQFDTKAERDAVESFLTLMQHRL
jgi:hypothetical protein